MKDLIPMNDFELELIRGGSEHNADNGAGGSLAKKLVGKALHTAEHRIKAEFAAHPLPKGYDWPMVGNDGDH